MIDQVEASDKAFLAPSLMRLNLDINVRNRGGPVSKETGKELSKTLIAGAPWSALFKTIRLKLNNTVVSDSEGFHPHLTQHLCMTKIPRYLRETLKETGMLYEDIAITTATTHKDGARIVVLPSLEWRDLNQRLELYDVNNPEPISLSFYVFTDVCWGSKVPLVLPPGVSLELELHPSPPERSIIKTLPDAPPMDPVIEVSRAYLTIPRITPATSSIRRSLNHQFMRLSTQALLIPKGSTLFIGALSYAQTPLPSRLTLRVLAMKAFDGSYSTNLLASRHMSIHSITYSIAGRTYPAHPIVADFDKDSASEFMIANAESLRYSVETSGAALPTRRQFMNGSFYHSIDISNDLSADASWTCPKERGSITLNIRFNRPTDEQIMALVISETVSELKINNSGEVSISS